MSTLSRRDDRPVMLTVTIIKSGSLLRLGQRAIGIANLRKCRDDLFLNISFDWFVRFSTRVEQLVFFQQWVDSECSEGWADVRAENAGLSWISQQKSIFNSVSQSHNFIFKTRGTSRNQPTLNPPNIKCEEKLVGVDGPGPWNHCSMTCSPSTCMSCYIKHPDP